MKKTDKMEEKSTEYNAKECLKEVFHEALPCQSSIYGSCTIPDQDGVRPARILLSPLLKNFKVRLMYALSICYIQKFSTGQKFLNMFKYLFLFYKQRST